MRTRICARRSAVSRSTLLGELENSANLKRLGHETEFKYFDIIVPGLNKNLSWFMNCKMSL
jgi:hypothetical protein